MEVLKKERATAKSQFTRKLHIFEKSVVEDDHIDILNDVLQELNVKFSKLELIHDQMIILAQNDNEIAKCNEYISAVEGLKIKANNDYLCIKDFREKSKQNAANLKFCVKKIPTPIFDGRMRIFPSFVSDYERLMVSKYGKDLFVLKSCLTDNVINQFNWVEDYDIMWNRLHEKCGSAPKIVDFVVSNIN